MLVLDCDTRSSAVASVASIYGLSSQTIESFLRDFDIDAHYERTHPSQSGDQELRHVFEAKFNVQPKQPDRVCWFHLTRAPKGTDFSEGLLPPSASLDRVWQAVLSVFEGTEHEVKLRELRHMGVPSWHYSTKVGNPIHAGPYAMLVRDVATQSKAIGNHDYLWLPEIMDDICAGYCERYGDPLYELLSQALVPTTVKFWSAKKRGNGCVAAALFYLYLSAHNEPLSLYANTCFDGENSPIPPSQVLSVHADA